jgi:hypothetical protein
MGVLLLAQFIHEAHGSSQSRPSEFAVKFNTHQSPARQHAILDGLAHTDHFFRSQSSWSVRPICAIAANDFKFHDLLLLECSGQHDGTRTKCMQDYCNLHHVVQLLGGLYRKRLPLPGFHTDLLDRRCVHRGIYSLHCIDPAAINNDGDHDAKRNPCGDFRFQNILHGARVRSYPLLAWL